MGVAGALGWTGRLIPNEHRFERRELTRAERSSILRAIHRVIDNAPGWKRECHRRSPGSEYSDVSFSFRHPDETSQAEGHKLALANLMQRPVTRRQQAEVRRARKLAREEWERGRPEREEADRRFRKFFDLPTTGPYSMAEVYAKAGRR
jgi:hypothetical protein